MSEGVLGCVKEGELEDVLEGLEAVSVGELKGVLGCVCQRVHDRT